MIQLLYNLHAVSFYISALYGCVFTEEGGAAYSNFRMWHTAGLLVAFIYSGYLCVFVKLVVLLAMLALGMLGYMVVEFQERRKAIAHVLDSQQ